MEPPPRAPDQEMTNIFEPAPKRPAPQKAQKAAAKKKPRKQVETHAPTGNEVAKFFTTTTEKLKEAYEKQQKEQEERKEEEEEDQLSQYTLFYYYSFTYQFFKNSLK